jgi:GTPase SAR1 family protein
MALPGPDVQDQPALVGEKRKREADDTDPKDEYQQDGCNATVEPDSVVPDDYEYQNSDDDDEDQLEDEDEESVIEEVSEIPTHDDSKEPFPECAIYDADIRKIEERITVLPKNVLSQLTKHDCLGQALKLHTSRAEKLTTLPQTPKLRIAILGCAGAGKSSLLNAITGKADLAKSLSGGQSCTCVPTEYQDAFTGQTLDFAAKFHYLQPDGVRLQLRETIKDYNTFAFEVEDDWDEDTRMSAKKAHGNAMKVLRTLFNDNPRFATKNATVGCMSAMYTQQDLLLEELAANCGVKLKHTAPKNYTVYHEAKTLVKLRSRIDPLMSSTGIFDEPSLWPLLRHVVIGVRASRVLEKVTLIDLPGISDTNQSRVELTHDFIGSCDYIWIVAPISRAVDDATVFQLLSRYGKHFKGMLCVICTHSDDGIIASETKLVNYFRQEDQDVKQYVDLSDRMKAKKYEITTLKAQIAQIKKKKKRATKQQMMDVREEEESLKGLTRDFAHLEAERFGFLVQTRNALITEQMQDVMQSHLPPGHVLEVHCISNSHYAALNRAGIRGPRLTAEATGIPKLRTNTIALVAPKLLSTLEHYVAHDVKQMLEQLQLSLSDAPVDRRVELLALASQPRDQLPAMVNVRLASSAASVRTVAEVTLRPAIPEASKAALEQLARKETKHWKTIAAFIRKDGNHATKMCPKESWNENFMKSLTDVVIVSLALLSQTRAQLTGALERGIIESLNDFVKIIRGTSVFRFYLLFLIY